MAGEFGQHRAQVGGGDAGDGVAPPQPHVEIGMLAAEKFDHLQAADPALPERPEEERRTGRVEGDDDERRHALERCRHAAASA